MAVMETSWRGRETTSLLGESLAGSSCRPVLSGVVAVERNVWMQRMDGLNAHKFLWFLERAVLWEPALTSV